MGRRQLNPLVAAVEEAGARQLAKRMEAKRQFDARLAVGDACCAEQPPRTYTVVIPIRTVSGLNVREHHYGRARRVKAERKATWHGCVIERVQPLKPNEVATVTLTRIASSTLDSDAVPGSMKACRDEIAAVLGLPDDRDGCWVTWRYGQEKAPRGTWAVRAEIAVRRQG